MGFTRAQLEAHRGGTLPDLIGPTVRLLFVGINPGLWTVATQSHFGRRGNRFYPALYRAGITDRIITTGAIPTFVNGSALLAVRTNEAYLGSPWEMRSFALAMSSSSPVRWASGRRCCRTRSGSG